MWLGQLMWAISIRIMAAIILTQQISLWSLPENSVAPNPLAGDASNLSGTGTSELINNA